ncbi:MULTISPECIES: lipopolysaccharide assembly protein LapA domain-containing protein [unclassified Leptolyngbya]|uniref:lipopolysaccharide assembly protein LapA domain-containing protein n=1 Tax=unclassified Leptolyngbya TaxID=2650499 RepID=UPI001685D4A1|nr:MULTISPECIES: lipopolysaccharide assembly protein LapA domain-containing protein [unclassified Leptolyngbya]MBD1910396.1 DUF1049 domain-containing protein [Leptolyngbya sp. FACHB-8]MBD2157792.1 DUF1049 domain-containing protein [Leptolyngbya sp. FACHB-16]
MVNFVVSSLTAIWVSAIALLSVQNATPVTLRLLGFQMVPIPIGLLMGFSASAGLVGTAVLTAGSRSAARSLDRDDDFE